jgi:hypothetical protein
MSEPRHTGKVFRRFSPEETRSRFTIIRLVADAKTRDGTLYEARYGCCGKLTTISHTRLQSYRLEARVSCPACLNAARKMPHAETPGPVCFSDKPLTDWLMKRQLGLVFRWAAE